MSESNPGQHPARTSSVVRRSRWPGWIWAVPLAAFGVVIWLGVSALIDQGVNATIDFPNANGVSANTKVEYRGVKIGEVTDIALAQDGRHVTAKINFDGTAKHYLTTGTRFWLEGASPSLSDLSSLAAIITGPTIEMAPGPGAPTRHFDGLDRRPTIAPPHGALVRFVANFDGAVGQLATHAPVTLRGFTVGEVESVALRFDPASGRLETPVVFALDPARFHLQPTTAHQTSQAQLTPVLDDLVAQGLRAQLTQSPPLIGDYAIVLSFVAGASKAQLDTSGKMPVFPAYSGGGVNSIIERANQVPIDKIAAQILAITDQVGEIVSSPALHQSITNLNQALAALNHTVRRSGPQVTALVSSLRATAAQLDNTVNRLDTTINAANRVLGAPPASQDNNVRVALYELTETARSVRALADYLNRHPGALLRGNAG